MLVNNDAVITARLIVKITKYFSEEVCDFPGPNNKKSLLYSAFSTQAPTKVS